MISYLSGIIRHKNDRYIILDVKGVGYKVYCCQNFSQSFSLEDDVQVFTHLHCREDLLDLYGFSSEELLRLFELLISVSGVGPKAALNIMNMLEVGVLVSAIKNREVKILVTVPGIGKKVAEKIVLELSDKIEKSQFSSNISQNTDNADLIEALVGMGYGSMQASRVLSEVPAEGTIGERLKVALRLLGK